MNKTRITTRKGAILMSTQKKFIVGKLNKLSAVYKWKHIVVQRILNIFFK